jgi:hypothetical protein
MDWMRDINNATQRDQVETFLDWLLATDRYGTVGYHRMSGGSLCAGATPRRALDTRATDDRFSARQTRTVALGQVPAGATGVIVNLASIDSGAGGYVTGSAPAAPGPPGAALL